MRALAHKQDPAPGKKHDLTPNSRYKSFYNLLNTLQSRNPKNERKKNNTNSLFSPYVSQLSQYFLDATCEYSTGRGEQILLLDSGYGSKHFASNMPQTRRIRLVVQDHDQYSALTNYRVLNKISSAGRHFHPLHDHILWVILVLIQQILP